MLRCRKGSASISWLLVEYDVIVMRAYSWHVWLGRNLLCQCTKERWVD